MAISDYTGQRDDYYGPSTGFIPPEDQQVDQPLAPKTETQQNPFNPAQQVGHDGTFNNMTREQWRDAWMGSGVNSVQGAKDWFAQNGGTWLSDNGTVLTPYGETMDLLINARGSAAGSGVATPGWGGTGGGGGTTPVQDYAGNRQMPLQTTAGSGQIDPRVQELMNMGWSQADAEAWAARYYTPQTQEQSGGSAPGSTPAANAADGYPEDNKAALMQLLRERMVQDLNVDPNDPVIKNQVDNYAAAQERQRRQYLNEAAEQASVRGLADSGALETERRMSNEKAGIATSGFQAELMGRELSARRDEIQQALDSMGNLLTEAERQALQRELAAADNALRRYGIDTQNNQYFAGLGQADRHFLAELAQRDRLAGSDDAFRYAQLGQADSQFRDQLGFNTADRQAYWDAVRRGVL